ncbi:MAG TPA: gamma-glutamyltransferase family protein [Candidatus Binatia bacterium]|nr:gamma-glutamyltransferase family protein [Candidatus Binatia bacterium]
MSGAGWEMPYPSRRMPVLASNVVATSQPLAAQAGLSMLARGGNALDAALATAIALTVVEPTNNGLGSDAFAIVASDSQLHGLNASGRSAAAMTRERMDGHERMPAMGWDSVTVPGAVSAWAALSKRFGQLPFDALFEPAIRYARDGFLVSPVVAEQWALVAGIFGAFDEFSRVFLPHGRAPKAGERFCLPDLARSLERIAASEGEDLYRGELAEALAAHAAECGAALARSDLEEHRADWVDPIAAEFAGVRVHEIPPNGQGIAALMALKMLAHTPVLEHEIDSAPWLHLSIEAMKLALADVRRLVADPDCMSVSSQDLLGDAYLAERARCIDPRRASDARPGPLGTGDTVYLCAADAGGMMVSYIQSNYFSFGSGIVVPGTGISLQNRGSGFVLERGHPNCVGPRKRPFHTIIPAMASRSGRPEAAFGVMGGPMQAQGHVQMVLRMFGHGQNPQAAADAPRWQVTDTGSVLVEETLGENVRDELVAMGHGVATAATWTFGGAQIIQRIEGGYVAASEPRKDGQAVGF